MSDLSNIDVFILSGGAGTRLRPVIADRSKVVADVGGKPFLDILLEELSSWGFKRIILGVGHMKEGIMKRYQENQQIEFSEETEPLGTGGAVKNAWSLFSSDHVLIMNGDSFCEVDYQSFFDHHIKNDAVASIVLSQPSERDDTGNVTIDETTRITNFKEKSSDEGGKGFVNAGIYLLRKDAIEHMPEENVFSIERDFFPKIIDKKCHGFVVEKEVLDIGTPERYQKINDYFTERFKKN